MIIKNLMLVGFGGMLGSMLRFTVYMLFGNEHFPFSTLLINIAGSFVIGIVIGLAARHAISGDWRLFLATGICGGFTTFSAFSIEAVSLLQQSRSTAALLYIFGSVVFSLVAAFAGYSIGK